MWENGFAVTERAYKSARTHIEREADEGLPTVRVCIHMHVISENFTAIASSSSLPSLPLPILA